MPVLYAGSMYGALNQKGLVEIKVPNGKVLCDTHEARAFALSILEAAEAAEGDEFIVSFFKNKVGVGQNEAGMMLKEFREHRESMKRRNEG